MKHLQTPPFVNLSEGPTTAVGDAEEECRALGDSRRLQVSRASWGSWAWPGRDSCVS